MSSMLDPDFEKKIAKAQEDNDDLHLFSQDKHLPIGNINTPIHFPEETWEEIIMWIKRIELAECVSMISDKFFRISYPFMHEEKKHLLPRISIYGGNNESWIYIHYKNGKVKKFSKSEVPTHFEVSENIVGEKSHIKIREVEEYVLKFMQLLSPIYSTISLTIKCYVFSIQVMQNPSLVNLMDLMKGKVQKLTIDSNFSLSKTFAFYPFLLDNTLMLCAEFHVIKKNLKLIKNWLYKARSDGKPKILNCFYNIYRDFIEMIKEDFVTTEQPTFFVIRFIENDYGQNFSFNPLNSVNPVTGERLTIQRRNESPYVYQWFIGRMPGDCSKSAFEISDEIDNLMESLANIEIIP